MTENRHSNGAIEIPTVVIGGGQAGLSVGYHLARRGQRFVILDAERRTGDQWRRRWDSLRLFTAAKFDGLDGMPFPAPANSFPTKDEMADYLEAYAARFALPVRHGATVQRLSRDGRGFRVETTKGTWTADNVVVAMAGYQVTSVPDFAADLAGDIVQVEAGDYRRPEQLRDGPVLVVGAGNSGSELALEAVANGHRTILAGREVGQLPFRIDSVAGRRVLGRMVLRVLFHRVLTVRTPAGRKMRPKVLGKGTPLIRLKAKEVTAAGVERVGRVTGVEGGRPQLEDGRVLDVANVIWCTGFHPGFSWIDLPIHGDHGPDHERGIVESQPGLYFVGLTFLYAMSSSMIHGVGRDAARIVDHLVSRPVEPTEGIDTAPSRPIGRRSAPASV